MASRLLGLAELLEERNLSQRDIARQLGCSQGAVNYWLRTSDAPSPRYHATLVEALGLDHSQADHLLRLHLQWKLAQTEDAA